MTHKKKLLATSISTKEKITIDFSKTDNYLSHIEFLRNNFSYLVDYKTQVGQLQPILKMVLEDLFNEDPFIVYSASLIATLAFADQNLYH